MLIFGRAAAAYHSVRAHSMVYSLHIERADSSIPLDEWLAAASAINCLRPRETGYTAANPSSGDRIEVCKSIGDLEIVLPQSTLARVLGKSKEWQPAFFFSQGRATVPPPQNIDCATDPIRTAASALARALNARIIGDEGEEYAW